MLFSILGDGYSVPSAPRQKPSEAASTPYILPPTHQQTVSSPFKLYLESISPSTFMASTLVKNHHPLLNHHKVPDESPYFQTPFTVCQQSSQR